MQLFNWINYFVLFTAAVTNLTFLALTRLFYITQSIQSFVTFSKTVGHKHLVAGFNGFELEKKNHYSVFFVQYSTDLSYSL